MSGSACAVLGTNRSVGRVDYLVTLSPMATITHLRVNPVFELQKLTYGAVRAPWSLPLCRAYVSDQPQDAIGKRVQEWDVMPTNEVVCRACGCGDNTIIGHWTRWCVVPLIVAIAILRPNTLTLTLRQLACYCPRNAAICTLILASFRRLLRQEGAFLHQRAAEPNAVTWWIAKLHEMVARDAHV